MKENNLKFHTSEPLFADNGKVSRREYPCGGELVQYTDEKSVYIIKPIKNRIDFPNIHFTDKEWELILSGHWVNGTIPELQKLHSFKFWKESYDLNILNKC